MLNAAIIGLGVGERHIEGYEATGRCKVTALCDIDKDKLAEVSARNPGRHLTNSPDDILQDTSIDVVSIASYDNDHHTQIMMAIDNKKHIFVEKPLCLHDSEFNDIARKLKENPDIKLSSNLILRRTHRFLALKKRIDQGEFGSIYYMEGDYNYGRLHKITEGWRGQIPFYSVVHGGAIHLIDLILWLRGGRVREVSAFGNQIATKDTDFHFNDFVAALLRFEDGSIAKITANFGCVFPHYHNLSIYGRKCSFVHGAHGANYYHTRDPKVAPEGIDDIYPGTQKGDVIPSFVAHILDGSKPEVDSADVLEAMAVSLAIENSIKTGGTVSVEYAGTVCR